MIDNIKCEKLPQWAVFSTGDEYCTKGGFGVRKFCIDSNGFPEHVMSVVSDDTKIKDYSEKFNIENAQSNKNGLKIEKMYCKVVSISDDGSVTAAIDTKNGRVYKSLDEYFILILKNIDLFKLNAEFFMVYQTKLNGMDVSIEKYTAESVQADDWYNDLYNQIEKKC